LTFPERVLPAAITMRVSVGIRSEMLQDAVGIGLGSGARKIN
jgi:hypothetical protein